ncbi:AraC family transcriptional regulator [Flagellimonas profundi]|uniref:Helix-turn-helix domain-containing protein n=1 Tax=Flagellimonas profundi TaxID=2915620 RepID=A0ABS3FJV0_9FLAO|nr:AraC family transcriptional regulator [Allomuricauda profundi]MBO0343488.1 helix-turn-helix domain-containing protein [Allomuricauda profundi]
MKPILIDSNSIFQGPVTAKKLYLPYLNSPLHFHNVYEIVLIEKGEGKRVVGDHVDRFTNGDLVFMGPRLPHFWCSDKECMDRNEPEGFKAIIVHFDIEWLEGKSLATPESYDLRKILAQVQRGVSINGKPKQRIAIYVKKLAKGNYLQRLIYLLKILDELKDVKSYDCLASVNFRTSYDHKKVERIEKIYQYVMNNFTRPIKLDEVANVAHMTPTAFCKYFKSYSHKTFTTFLNEFRIGHACKLLHDRSLTISQIYLQCGFNNFSNFNRSFKVVKNMSPTEYRDSIP